MRPSFLAIFSILVFAISIFAANNNGDNSASPKPAVSAVTISGFVEDLTNNEKLVCAKIEIEELGKTLFTDILGNYIIDDIEPGTYSLRISYISYEELELKEITFTDQKELNIQLKPL